MKRLTTSQEHQVRTVFSDVIALVVMNSLRLLAKNSQDKAVAGYDF
jgi:hypothetical protein